MTSIEDAPTPQPIKRITVRNHDWAYAHLQMVFDPPYTAAELIGVAWPPDILTWRTSLTSALTQYLGVTGSAIHIDILHLNKDETWMRIPRVDMKNFGAATSGYVGTVDGRQFGFRTLSLGEFLMGLISQETEKSIWAD